MNQQLILQPVVAMFLLTAAVWVCLFARRIPYLVANKIDAQSVASPEALMSKLPARVNQPANNFKNLFELPVVFYAVCAFLLLSQKVDEPFLYAAWAFVGLRAIHSLIHCTVNNVNLRFMTYMLSSLTLWFMVGRLALSVL